MDSLITAAAERALAGLDPAPFPPASRAAYELTVAGIALRRLRTVAARAALARAERAAADAGIPALMAEVESAQRVLDVPAARRIARGTERLLRLHEAEQLLGFDVFVVDVCRRAVRQGPTVVSLATRPVLLALARTVEETLVMPPGRGVSGLESDGGERLFCGGGASGTVRVVRRPKKKP